MFLLSVSSYLLRLNHALPVELGVIALLPLLNALPIDIVFLFLGCSVTICVDILIFASIAFLFISVISFNMLFNGAYANDLIYYYCYYYTCLFVSSPV